MKNPEPIVRLLVDVDLSMLGDDVPERAAQQLWDHLTASISCDDLSTIQRILDVQVDSDEPPLCTCSAHTGWGPSKCTGR